MEALLRSRMGERDQAKQMAGFPRIKKKLNWREAAVTNSPWRTFKIRASAEGWNAKSRWWMVQLILDKEQFETQNVCLDICWCYHLWIFKLLPSIISPGHEWYIQKLAQQSQLVLRESWNSRLQMGRAIFLGSAAYRGRRASLHSLRSPICNVVPRMY